MNELRFFAACGEELQLVCICIDSHIELLQQVCEFKLLQIVFLNQN